MKKSVHVLFVVTMSFFLLSAITATFACEEEECDPCYEWDPDANGGNGGCVSKCEGGEDCCDNTCYDPSTKICCDDGYGTVCNNTECCCDTPAGGPDFCCELIGGWLCSCCQDVCCSAGQVCCDNGCCDECCGTEGCCESGYYCCGHELCCDDDEVCCWYLDEGIYYYCNPPCREEVTDTTTCSEENSPEYNCNVCRQVASPTCTTYLVYDNLEIKTCYDGCWWTTPNEVCYVEKDCFPRMYEEKLCLNCQGKNMCLLTEGPQPLPGFPEEKCTTIGACIIEIACDILLTCFQCEEGEEVVETFYQETCQCPL